MPTRTSESNLDRGEEEAIQNPQRNDDRLGVVNDIPSFAIRRKPKARPKPAPSSDESTAGSAGAGEQIVGRKRQRVLRGKTSGLKPQEEPPFPLNDDDSDDEDYVPTEQPPKPNSRRANVQKSHAQANPAKEPWTEVFFSSHVLTQNFQAYMEQHQYSMTQVEKDFLDKWVANVQAELQKQNGIVVENIQLVTALKKLCKQRNKLQDQILLQKKSIQALKVDAELQKREVKQAKQHETKVESASQFLASLQKLTSSN